MKILCVSDQIDPLVYSNSIKERFAGVGLALSAGDLPLDYLEFIVSSLNIPLLFVFGNHNLKEYAYYLNGDQGAAVTVREQEQHSSGLIHTHGKVHREGGLLIAGLGGSLRYNHGENQYTNFDMYWEIAKLLPALLWNRLSRGRYLDILLTHAPPQGIGDRDDPCHRGFRAFLWFMRVFKPKYLIHGHVHLYDLSEVRVRSYQDTLILNAYGHHIIDTEAGHG
ncbi:MAG: metallophosphoesterase [Treponema sp.]|jgi:Icc-related predicted phosphoesterase|nr:metallophosphoesterase [Treponema sp.]